MVKKSILIGLLILSLIFCITPGAISREFLSIMTCGTAGTYYPMGAGIARIWQTHVPDANSTAESSGCSVVNLRLMAKGRPKPPFAKTMQSIMLTRDSIFSKTRRKLSLGAC